MGRTCEGSDDNPGRFASGFTMERDGVCGPLVGIIPSKRHERSHIMYWSCGGNRLVSFVKRETRVGQGPIPSSLRRIQLSESVGVFL